MQIAWLHLILDALFQFNCDQMNGELWFSLLTVNAALFPE